MPHLFLRYGYSWYCDNSFSAVFWLAKCPLLCCDLS
uniref:Uncharacterized protein n=1 Tax=Arundo donax TaxID=35708 RepID=A0A0A8YYV6_ARUDO